MRFLTIIVIVRLVVSMLFLDKYFLPHSWFWRLVSVHRWIVSHVTPLQMQIGCRNNSGGYSNACSNQSREIYSDKISQGLYVQCSIPGKIPLGGYGSPEEYTGGRHKQSQGNRANIGFIDWIL